MRHSVQLIEIAVNSDPLGENRLRIAENKIEKEAAHVAALLYVDKNIYLLI